MDCRWARPAGTSCDGSSITLLAEAKAPTLRVI